MKRVSAKAVQVACERSVDEIVDLKAAGAEQRHAAFRMRSWPLDRVRHLARTNQISLLAGRAAAVNTRLRHFIRDGFPSASELGVPRFVYETAPLVPPKASAFPSGQGNP
jgi:hypothetical protein